MTNSIPEKCPWPAVAPAGYKFVGFIDILGFSDRVLNGTDQVIKDYRSFCESLVNLDDDLPIELTIYSDAILIVSDELSAVATKAQMICWFALHRDLVVRGGVSYGRFWSEHHAKGLMVVSEALVRAVQMEKEVGHPAIVFDRTIEFPDIFWAHHLADPESCVWRPILHFEGLNVVNPFNSYWFRSARGRFLTQLERATQEKHQEKYKWILKLWDALNEFQPMVPEGTASRLINASVIEWVPFDDDFSGSIRAYRIPPGEL